jgi:putative ABC transport system substrate-binding protein
MDSLGETGPVGSGLVASFSHPGGNVTGLFFDFPDFTKKWLVQLSENEGLILP